METIYYLYQITNLINGKIYVGVHRTDDLDDGYRGSGLLIRRAIQKYGVENFQKEILKFFRTEKDMFQEEAEIVNLDFIHRGDTYNLTEGGDGRFPPDATWKALASKTPEQIREFGRRGYQSVVSRYGHSLGLDLDKWNKTKDAEIARAKGTIAAQSKEAKEKRRKTQQERQHQQGSKNSQYGTMWITTGTENKKIKKDCSIPEGWVKGYHPKHQLIK